jgi:adiponectin receptor
MKTEGNNEINESKKENLMKLVLGDNKYSTNNTENSVKKGKIEDDLKYTQNSLNIPIIDKNSTEKSNNLVRRLGKFLTNINESNIESKNSLNLEGPNLNVRLSSCNDDSSKLGINENSQLKEKEYFYEKENGHLKLITYKECPKWLADNPYIHLYYRPPCYSYKECYKSLFYLHNESGNIYTHLIGSILFTFFFILTTLKFIPSYENLEFIEIVTIILSIIGGFICMQFSWHFHLFSSHSIRVNQNWLKCDHIGIVFLIFTTGFPVTYYSFYCYQEIRTKFLAITSIISIISIISIAHPVFYKEEYKLIRSILYVALGTTEFIPVSYSMIFYKYDFTVKYLSLYYSIAGVVIYLIGLVIYAKCIPESIYPGSFDIFGHSHQIFHTLILIASITFYIGIMKMIININNDPNVCQKL